MAIAFDATFTAASPFLRSREESSRAVLYIYMYTYTYVHHSHSLLLLSHVCIYMHCRAFFVSSAPAICIYIHKRCRDNRGSRAHFSRLGRIDLCGRYLSRPAFIFTLYIYLCMRRFLRAGEREYIALPVDRVRNFLLF